MWSALVISLTHTQFKIIFIIVNMSRNDKVQCDCNRINTISNKIKQIKILYFKDNIQQNLNASNRKFYAIPEMFVLVFFYEIVLTCQF